MVDVKNDMEHMVRQEVGRRKGDPGERRKPCWCAVCEADVIALALNNLPPCYCRSRNFGYAAAQGFAGRVREAVDRALDKVTRRPRHRPDAPDRYRAEARVEDFALKIGSSLAGTAPPGEEGACFCEGCRADALALALNRYPPKYGVSWQGRASYQENFEDFIRHEIGQALLQARQVIWANPNH